MLVTLVVEQGIHLLMLSKTFDIYPKHEWNSRYQWHFSAIMAVCRHTVLFAAYYGQNRLNLHKDGTKAAFSVVEMKSILLCLAVNSNMIPSAVLYVW